MTEPLPLSDKRPHRPVLGVLAKLASVVLLAGMAAAIKYLGGAMPVGESIFVRGLIAVLALASLAHFSGGIGTLRTRNLGAHLRRSLSGTISMFFFFAALIMIPFADLTAIGYAQPSVVTLLAMIFLGERIHAFRWSALVIGLLGVLIMISPHLSLRHGSSLGALMAVGAMSFSAVAMIYMRRMSGAESALNITFYFMLTSMLCGLLTLPFGWVVPTASQWLALLLMGLFGVAGQLLLSYSYRYAEASTIAPLEYTSMIMAVAIGHFMFNEAPHPAIWAGVPLVIASGLIIFWREYRLHKQLSTTSID